MPDSLSHIACRTHRYDLLETRSLTAAPSAAVRADAAADLTPPASSRRALDMGVDNAAPHAPLLPDPPGPSAAPEQVHAALRHTPGGVPLRLSFFQIMRDQHEGLLQAIGGAYINQASRFLKQTECKEGQLAASERETAGKDRSAKVFVVGGALAALATNLAGSALGSFFEFKSMRGVASDGRTLQYAVLGNMLKASAPPAGQLVSAAGEALDRSAWTEGGRYTAERASLQQGYAGLGEQVANRGVDTWSAALRSLEDLSKKVMDAVMAHVQLQQDRINRLQ